MRTSLRGINLIKEHEGLRLEAYRCPAGIYTIGYGHTAGVRRGDVIVNRECPGVNQNQFDALVSFTFNLGETNLRKSTLLKCVKANPNNLNIRTEFLRWNRSKGEVLPGLIRRRKDEADLYFS